MTTWSRTGAPQPRQAPPQPSPGPPLAAPPHGGSGTESAPQPHAAQPPASLNITITQTKPPRGFWEVYNVARSVSWMVLFVLILGTIVSKCG